MSDDDLILVPPREDEPAPQLRPVRVKPGQRPPQVDPSVEYLLLAPTAQRASFAFSGHDFGGVTFRAFAPLRGGEHALLFDACRRFNVEGVEATGAGHGIRLRGCEDAAAVGCRTSANATEGFIIGGCRRIRIARLRTWRNGRPGNDRGHGLYLSYQSEDVTVEDLESTGNSGAGIHINSPTDERGVGPMKRVTIRRGVLRDNGSHGTGNLDFMYTQGALLEDSLIVGGVGGASTWDDGAGDTRKGAKGIVLRRVTILNERWALRLEAGGVVSVEASIVAGPVSVDRTSRITYDTLTKRGGAASQARAEWLDPATLRSLLPGVGYQG